MYTRFLAAALVLSAGAAQAAPDVTRAPFGNMSETGAPVEVFTLKNDAGMSVKVITLGGIIAEINAPDRKGQFKNVVLGVGTLKEYEGQGTMNALIGRYANRLKNGFTLDGKHYDLPANPKGVTIHGGRPGYGSRIWSAEPVNSAGAAALRLSLVSPDGDQSFPGTLTIHVTYTLTPNNDLRLDYEATTDKPTIINLTNHAYFNLAGNGSGSVYGQRLQLMSDQVTLTDADQVPTGELGAVAGTALDFRQLTPIGARINSAEPQMLIARGYDHNFVLRKPAGDPLPLAGRMYDPVSGRLMELRTTEPGVQIYTANGFNGSLVSAAGTTVRQGDALALETQHAPNSPNIPSFPTTVLRPGETFRSTTVFHFTTDKGKEVR